MLERFALEPCPTCGVYTREAIQTFERQRALTTVLEAKLAPDIVHVVVDKDDADFAIRAMRPGSTRQVLIRDRSPVPVLISDRSRLAGGYSISGRVDLVTTPDISVDYKLDSRAFALADIDAELIVNVTVEKLKAALDKGPDQ
jgi:hypothetical protein